MKITKQDIWTLDLSAAPENLTELDKWAKTNKLGTLHTWLLPQMVAWFGTWELKEDGKATVLHNCDTRHKRILYLLTRIPRASILLIQRETPQYAKLTPLILRGFKQNQNRKYETFRNYPGLKWLLEPELFEAVVDIDTTVKDISPDELLQIRVEGLTIKSGSRETQVKSAESTWCLTGIAGTKLGHLPKLTNTMLTQIWVAGPGYRNEYQILDPFDWDNMPKPLLNIMSEAPKNPLVPKEKINRDESPFD